MTDDAGTVVERRYLREERFVLLVGRYVVSVSELKMTDAAVMNPRSLFFQSELYHRLNGTDGRQPGPLLDPVNVSWRDEARDNEDGVHLALNAGERLWEDWTALRDLALRNGTGGTIATWVDPTPYLPLLGLPHAALAGVSYEPLPNDASASYNWSTGEATTPTVWDLLWAGAAEVRDRTLEFVFSALAFYVDFYDAYVESLVQFGLWLWDTVANSPQAIQDAVGAAGEAFGQFATWTLDFVRQVVRQAVDPILSPIHQLLDAWVAEAAQRFIALSEAADTWDVADEATALVNAFLVGTLPELVFALSAAIVISLMVVGVAASVTPAGAIAATVKEVIKELIETAIEHWIATTILLSAVAGWVLSQFSEAGQLSAGILGIIEIAWGAWMVLYANRNDAPVAKDIIGLFLSIMGTLVIFRVLPLPVLTGSRVIAAVIGTGISATGLLIALGGEDIAPPPLGYVDEALVAGSLGFDLAQTGVAISDCVAGQGC